MFHLNPGNNCDNTALDRQEESLLVLMLTNDSTEMRDKVLCQNVTASWRKMQTQKYEYTFIEQRQN